MGYDRRGVFLALWEFAHGLDVQSGFGLEGLIQIGVVCGQSAQEFVGLTALDGCEAAGEGGSSRVGVGGGKGEEIGFLYRNFFLIIDHIIT